jgi:predicted nucleic acid-binding protein
VEGMTTTKILDNTVISAFINEITSIKIIDVCTKQYDLVTSNYVYDETSKAINKDMLNDIYKNIGIIKRDGEKNYENALEYLKNRYPYLHEGELSAFLIALLDFGCHNKPYFFVTDDGKMRRKTKEIVSSDDFMKAIGLKIHDFRMTGTIGLIKRLSEKGCLSQQDVNKIASDLESSNFRAPESLINELRGHSA